VNWRTRRRFAPQKEAPCDRIASLGRNKRASADGGNPGVFAKLLPQSGRFLKLPGAKTAATTDQISVSNVAVTAGCVSVALVQDL